MYNALFKKKTSGGNPYIALEMKSGGNGDGSAQS